MDNAHLPGEAAHKAADRLRRECDLRDKDDHLPAAPDGFFGRPQIDLRFP